MALSKRIKEARKKPGGSNVGKYPRVKSFAGPAGGAPPGSFPIRNIEKGKAALKLAHNAPRPGPLKEKVYRKFPSLRKTTKKTGRA